MDSERILANNKITMLKAGERSAAYINVLNHERSITLHYVILTHTLHRFVSSFSKIFSSCQHEILFIFFRHRIYQRPNITQLPLIRRASVDSWHVKCCMYQNWPALPHGRHVQPVSLSYHISGNIRNTQGHGENLGCFVYHIPHFKQITFLSETHVHTFVCICPPITSVPARRLSQQVVRPTRQKTPQVKVKVKQSHYRPGVAQKVPGS